MHGPEPAAWDDANAPKLSALAVTDWLRFTLALVLWAKNRQCRVQRESCVKINYVFGA